MTDGIIVTGPGRLMCKNIIHMKARNSERAWHESIVKCLQCVEELGHNSVSFPAVGTGETPFLYNLRTGCYGDV